METLKPKDGGTPLDFSEMDIHCNSENYYDCEKVSIDTVLNQPVTVLGFQHASIGDRDKPDGMRRPLVMHLMMNGKECKVFTNSKLIKEQVNAIGEKYKDGVPQFNAKIVKVKAKYYRLAPATE